MIFEIIIQFFICLQFAIIVGCDCSKYVSICHWQCSIFILSCCKDFIYFLRWTKEPNFIFIVSSNSTLRWWRLTFTHNFLLLIKQVVSKNKWSTKHTHVSKHIRNSKFILIYLSGFVYQTSLCIILSRVIQESSLCRFAYICYFLY